MKPKTLAWTIGIVAVICVLLFWNRIFPSSSKPAATVSDPSQLAGLQTGNAPWAPELAHLAERLHAIGLSPLSAEGSAQHIHQHLDLFVNGQRVDIPAGIGINDGARFISDIHVHDNSGIIHIESPSMQTFTLGQFFDIWGVKFTADCIGGYCIDATHQITMYSNGAKVEGDLRTQVLQSHEEIVLYYGTAPTSTKDIPSSYTFPSGY